MTDHIEGLKSAADAAKQVITLSTGVMAISITFWEKLQGGGASASFWLLAAWFCLLAAVLASLITLFAITGTLNERDNLALGQPNNPPSVPDAMSPNITTPAKFMFFFFVAGLVLLAVAAVVRPASRSGSDAPAPNVIVHETLMMPAEQACPASKLPPLGQEDGPPPAPRPKQRANVPPKVCDPAVPSDSTTLAPPI